MRKEKRITRFRHKEAREALWRGMIAAMPPVPALSVSEWAEAHRVLSRESTAEHGRFSCDRVPYQRAAMDDATDPAVSQSIYAWAAQTGKSETLNNVLGYFMHADPSAILLVQPTVDLAEAYSKERIAPMIRDTPALRKLVRDPRSRDSGNTLLSKVFPGGNLALIGANAPSGLAGRPRRVILLDEVDRFPMSAGTEGDPCALADRRAESFPNSVKVKTSTPTVKGRSRIWSLLETSDFQKWFCKCPACDHAQVWAWSQVKWPENKPEEARLHCEKCDYALTDDERIESVRNGEWRATRPFLGIRGRWLNGINTLFRHHKGFRNRLHQMAAEFLQAKEGGVQTMRVWANTFLAEPYEEEAEAIPVSALSSRAEDYSPDTMPSGVLQLVAGCDVQNDRIEVTVWGFGIEEEAWAIEHKIFDGDPEQDAIWQAVDSYLLRTFTREDRCELKIERAFIDMGFKSRRVLAFCQPRLARGVYPCRGLNRVGSALPPLLPNKPSRNNRARIPHWNIGVTVAKTAIYDRLVLPVPGPRTVHFPDGCGFDESYFRQLTSERRRTRYSYGQPYFVFEKDNDKVRNEALDAFVYALAALESLGRVNWGKLAEMRRASIPPAPEGPTTPEPAETPPAAPQRTTSDTTAPAQPPPITAQQIASRPVTRPMMRPRNLFRPML